MKVMIKKIKLKKFTVFEDFELEFYQGINVFIGENGKFISSRRL